MSEEKADSLIPLEWHTEKRKVSDLQPFPGNPRKMTGPQKKMLKESLEKFNLVEIPAIDTEMRILAGNQRVSQLKAMKRGNDEIEVRVPNRPLTEDEAKEYLLRSNKNVGDWDYDLLLEFDMPMLDEVGFEGLSLLNTPMPETIDFIHRTDLAAPSADAGDDSEQSADSVDDLDNEEIDPDNPDAETDEEQINQKHEAGIVCCPFCNRNFPL